MINCRNKKILITGAAGFIGFHLSKVLMKENKIIGVDSINDYYDQNLKNDRLNILNKNENFIFYQADIANEDAVNNIFECHRPDVVINLAAQAGVRYSITNPKSYVHSNINGFYNILEACRNYPVEHLLFASSSSVYGMQEKTPFSVDDKVDSPISLYAATKKSNELMAYTYSHLYNIPSTGLRFFTVYGPWGRPDMAYFNFTNKILKNETIQVFNNGDLYRDFTYIDDIVYAICKMIGNPPKENEKGDKYIVYNIGNNKPENLMYFINTLENCIGKKANKEFLPMQAGDVYQTYADITPLKNDFGFEPKTELKDGLQKFWEWYKKYYKLNI